MGLVITKVRQKNKSKKVKLRSKVARNVARRSRAVVLCAFCSMQVGNRVYLSEKKNAPPHTSRALGYALAALQHE